MHIWDAQIETAEKQEIFEEPKILAETHMKPQIGAKQHPTV